jgi:transcription factor C subunit 6
MHEAAFTATPPSTVSACMTWLSPSDIAVGCANGFVAVYNIATSYNAETNGDPAPYISVPIHLTYILNIESAYPQHPSLVATTSMDGNTRLTSLLDPHKDTTDAGRMRMGSPHIMYSPLLQAFFSNDENDYIRAFSVRRFYTTTSVGRLPSTVSAIASSSRWHPSTMFGCTAGIALVTNPFRRVLHSKETHYHLKWFMHEWVEGKNDSADISRFQDGFLPESASLLRGTTGDERVANGVMVITIYDENMHITTMAWNPNQRYSGWAVAGMGCGLLRMEDIALGATDYDI